MFRVDMLPAERGDALWIEYGRPDNPNRILVDGGVSGKALRQRIELLAQTDRHFELVVVTHIDLDHIGGLLNLLRKPPAGLRIDDIWFNGYHHLADQHGVLGPKQGELVSYWIEERKLPWNAATKGAPIEIPPEACGLPTYTLAGGMQLTLLGPTRARLQALRKEWTKVIEKEGLEPGNAGRELAERLHPEDRDDEGVLGGGDVEQWAKLPEKLDRSVANGSSITFLAEYDGRTCLLTGDAFPADLIESLKRIDSGDPVRVDAMKLSHHGGKKNTCRALFDVVRCSTFLVSTNGSYYDHPDDESLAKVVLLAKSPTLCFNYATQRTAPWCAPARRIAHCYTTEAPTEGSEGHTLWLVK